MLETWLVGNENTDSGYITHVRQVDGQWVVHPLEEHLKSTANLTKQFVETFGASDWGYLAGLWHDLRKSS